MVSGEAPPMPLTTLLQTSYVLEGRQPDDHGIIPVLVSCYDDSDEDEDNEVICLQDASVVNNLCSVVNCSSGSKQELRCCPDTYCRRFQDRIFCPAHKEHAVLISVICFSQSFIRDQTRVVFSIHPQPQKNIKYLEFYFLVNLFLIK